LVQKFILSEQEFLGGAAEFIEYVYLTLADDKMHISSHWDPKEK
jgi:hypothetical protein